MIICDYNDCTKVGHLLHFQKLACNISHKTIFKPLSKNL